MDDHIPLFISPSILKVLVIGGGKVALRKCQYLEGAEITVLADDISPELRAHRTLTDRANIETVTRMMKDFDIVIAATDDKEMNDMIKDVAIVQGVPVNSAHGGGTVLIPSVLEKEGYVVSASTRGKVPAFLPFLIRELDNLLDERFSMMFDVLSETRNAFIDKGTQTQRSEHLKAVSLDPEVRHHIERNDLRSAVRRATEMGARE